MNYASFQERDLSDEEADEESQDDGVVQPALAMFSGEKHETVETSHQINDICTFPTLQTKNEDTATRNVKTLDILEQRAQEW